MYYPFFFDTKGILAVPGVRTAVKCVSRITVRDSPRGRSSRMASPARFERATPALGGRCSIQLSYGDAALRGRRHGKKRG